MHTTTTTARATIGVALVALLVPASAAFAADPPQPPAAEDEIRGILEEVDPWVVSDTTKILAFIGEETERTEERITSSQHWQPTVDALSEILGIDYLGAPDIDNTGRIYFSMRLTGDEQAFFRMDEPMGWPIQITPNGWTEQGLQTGYHRLDPDGAYLYMTVMKHGDEDWDIWRFGRDGSYEPLLVDRSISYGTPHIIDDTSFYFTIDNTEQIWFARYDLVTGAVDTLYTEPGAFYLLDHTDGKLLGIRFISFSESQLIEVDLESGEATDLTDIGLFWTGDYLEDGRVLTLCDLLSDEEEFLKLVTIDPESGDVELIHDPGAEVDDMELNKKLGRVVLILNRDGYSEISLVDLDGTVTTPPSPGVGIISTVALNDRGDMVFDFNSPSTPPTAYYVAAGSDELEQIGKVSTFGFDFEGIDVRSIEYPSTDGTMIPAFLYLPENAERDRETPFIVDYHGGPPGQSRPYFQRNKAFALAKGVGFLYPNVRGSTGYGPAWERADNLEGRFQALEDAEAALDYLVDEGWTSPERTAIWGASYGGYTVNYLAVHAPTKFACAVSEVGVADVDWSTEQGDQTFREGWEREMAPVGSELSKQLSPIYYADRIERPMLVTAGFNDPRVAPSGPRRFAYLLKRLGKDALYFEDVEAGHGASGRSDVVRDLARHYTFTFDHILK